MKFPQGEGSAVIHRKKYRPALQRRDILTVYLVSFFVFFFSFFFVYFFIGNLLRYSSTQFVVVLFFIAFCTAPFSSKHFFLGLFVRSLFTQQFFLVVLLLLLLSMTALSYVGLLSLFWVRLFHAVFPEPSSTQLFSWVVVFWAVCRAWIHSLVSVFAGAHSLAFLSLGVPFLGICGAVFIYT